MEILACYIRVSTEKQKQKNSSPQTQRELGAAVAELKGLEPLFYDDSGKSATKNTSAHMPEFNRLISDIHSGKIKYVYCYDVSRLTRSDSLTRSILDACKGSKALLFTQYAEYDLSNPQSEFMFKISANFATYAAQMSNLNSKQGVKRAIRDGRVQGSCVPYGYRKNKKTKQLEIFEEEAAIVRQIYENKLSGWSDQKICDFLNKENIKTKHGALLWRDQTIRHILHNTVYIGQRTSIYKIDPEPNLRIISDSIFKQVDSIYTRNRSYSYTPTSHQHLLKGLVVCGTCGRGMYGIVKEKKRHYVYMCSSKRAGYENCGCKNPNLFKLNDLTWGVVSEHLNNIFIRKAKLEELLYQNDPSTRNTLYNAEDFIKKTGKELDDINKKLEKLPWLYIEGHITQEKLIEIENQLLSEKTSIEKKMSSLNDTKKIDELAKRIALIHEELIEIHSKISSTDLQKKSALIKRMVEKITVYWVDQKHEIEIKFKLNSSLTQEDSVRHHMHEGHGCCIAIEGGISYTYKSVNWGKPVMTDIQLF